jgi:hypothetical protein
LKLGLPWKEKSQWWFWWCWFDIFRFVPSRSKFQPECLIMTDLSALLFWDRKSRTQRIYRLDFFRHNKLLLHDFPSDNFLFIELTKKTDFQRHVRNFSESGNVYFKGSVPFPSHHFRMLTCVRG